MPLKNYDYKDKRTNVLMLNQYMLAKTLSMFEWEGLPETIPYKELEKMLQVSGYAFITKVEDKLYCFTGGLGGEPDMYGNPTTITISNPALKFNKTLDLKKDGVLIINDDMQMGLVPLYTKHNTMIAENDINMMMWGYNSRSQRVFSASDDRTKDSALAYLGKIVDGELGVIGENPILEGVKVHGANSAQGVSITTMIEFQQYQKASLYNEVGLSANFNMKRERLISSEVDAGEDSLFPFVFNMMKCRLKGIEQVNEMFGTSIEIDFGSVWHFKNKQLVDDVIDPNKLPDEAKPDELKPVVETSGNSGEDLENGEGQKGERTQTLSPEPEPETDTKTETETEQTVDGVELTDEEKQALEDLEREKKQEGE